MTSGVLSGLALGVPSVLASGMASHRLPGSAPMVFLYGPFKNAGTYAASFAALVPLRF